MPQAYDSVIRHQVFLQRYAAGRAREAVRTLNRLRRQVVGRMADATTEFQAGRLGALLADIDGLLSDGFKSMSDTVMSEVFDQARNEADFTANIFDFTLPADSALIAAVSTRVMQDNLTIIEALNKFSVKKRQELANIIKDGIVLGDAPEIITRKVHTIMSTLHVRQVRALTHTVVNHVSSVGRSETYAANGVEKFEWVATLDSRTTLICGSRDGKTFRVGFGPMPPAHWNCRSTTVPAGTTRVSRPAVVDGKVQHTKQTYAQWLKRQSKSFQDEALGPERALLFRKGELKLDKFVDPTGRVYTLDQLKRMRELT